MVLVSLQSTLQLALEQRHHCRAMFCAGSLAGKRSCCAMPPASAPCIMMLSELPGSNPCRAAAERGGPQHCPI